MIFEIEFSEPQMLVLVSVYYFVFFCLMNDLRRTLDRVNQWTVLHTVFFIACTILPLIFVFHCIEK